MAVTTEEFLATHAVFTLNEAERRLRPNGGRSAVLERLKYALSRGRIKPVIRGVYATVPRGTDPDAFQPDPYVAAAAVREDAVFCYHSALDLLGASYSVWQQVTVYTARRRSPVTLDGVSLRFLSHPVPLKRAGKSDLGLRTLQRAGTSLRVTGPERTLVEGFRTPRLVGGVAEFVASVSGFPVLDFDLLLRVLRAYDERVLWGAVGWFLETHRERFFVEDALLARFEGSVPRSPQYVEPAARGGRLVSRWNVIVPETVASSGEPDER
jgi:predicted transcriptional regulator of viral defense system